MDYRATDYISVIVESVDIIDLISQHIELKKSGNSFKGLCPFHSEKTPSFFVNPEKKLFYCFGCGAGGNVISFIMKYNNYEFKDAISYIDSKYGLNLGNKKNNREYSKLYVIYDDFYNLSREYLNSAPGKNADRYLKNRGFTKDALDKFGLGYIPDNVNMKDMLNFSFWIWKS